MFKGALIRTASSWVRSRLSDFRYQGRPEGESGAAPNLGYPYHELPTAPPLAYHAAYPF